MNAPTVYDTVESLAGHDAGRFYQVVREEKGRLWLADGKLKKLAGPKAKSPKHVRLIARNSEAPATDKQIRTMLAQAAAAASQKGAELGER